MTGDTTPISDEARARVSAWLDDDEALRIPDTEWGRQLYADVRGLCAVPLLVSAEAERLREQRDNADMSANALAAEVEGLRAELAKLEAAITKLRATHADALADRDAITRVIMRERDRLRAELSNEVELRKSYQREVAALRTAGGQEKTDVWCSDIGSHLAATCMCPHCVMCLAPPVGGQHVSAVEAEPSDDGWDTCEHGVMGDHYFVEDTEWGVNHHYCPGRRHTAAAVSGEQR